MHNRFYSLLRTPFWILGLTLLSLISNPSYSLSGELPQELNGIGVTEHLGAKVDLNSAQLINEAGQSVTLSQYFQQGKPVILALVYYQCPQLCNLILNGLHTALKNLSWTAGNEFELVAVSINPKETPALAAQKKANYLKLYQRPEAEKGYHFLTGPEKQVRSIAEQVGFHYRYDEKQKQYLHAATLFILTPEGVISRYLYGVSFTAKNLRLSLAEAAQGKIGSVMDRVLLFCYHFDPNANSYTFQMWKIVQIVLTLQVLGMGFFLIKLWRPDWLRRTKSKQKPS